MKKELSPILELRPELSKKSGTTTGKRLETWVNWKKEVILKEGSIALLMTGLESPELIKDWKLTIGQYGKTCFKSIDDPHDNHESIVVPNCSLVFEDIEDIAVSKSDLAMQRWFLCRSVSDKKKRTIFTGNSGLVFATIRNMQTLVPIKKAKLCPIKDGNGATFFVDAKGCYGVRRYVIPKEAEILYTTEIHNSQDQRETIIMGFKLNNDVILLFHPQNLVNEESSDFFKITQNRYGSETFFNALIN
jgi:hypothetical protein